MSGRLPTKEKLMAWVDDYAEREGLDAARTLYLTKFASYASAASESWSKVDTLMRQCRCSERMLQKMRAEFEARGVLRNTGRFHVLEETSRRVPLYQWAMFLEEFEAEVSGARCAPEAGVGVHRTGPSGAQGVHLHNELKELTPSDEGDARTHARDEVFERLERAVPKACLGNSERGAARRELDVVLDEGVDGELLVRAAERWAAGEGTKRKDLGLQFWLRDRRFRGSWPEEVGAGQASAAAVALTPPSLPKDVAEVVYPAGLSSYLGGATWQDDGRVLVCRLSMQADEVRKRVLMRLREIGVRVVSAKELETEKVG